MANKRQPAQKSYEAGAFDDRDDEALMARIGQGDSLAFSQLIGRHRARVVGTAWRMMGNQADGEDIAQEAFARVWVHAAKWVSVQEGGAAKFSTWLYRIVLNLCIDRRRRPRAEPLETAPETADEAEDAFEGIARRQLGAAVARAIAALPDRQRQAIVLCVYEEVSNVEAARIMSLSVGAVESLLVRARRGLKETLAPLQADRRNE